MTGMIRALLSSLILSIVTGYCTGATVAAWTRYPSPPLRLIPDTGAAEIPVITIAGIRNSRLIGRVQGDVRVVAGSSLVLPDGSGSFSIGNARILTNVIEVQVPPGMRYVASKRGKKYYPVGSASANNLSPANRIYFPTAEVAEKAGYSR